MKCPNCGSEIRRGLKFCNVCGARIYSDSVFVARTAASKIISIIRYCAGLFFIFAGIVGATMDQEYHLLAYGLMLTGFSLFPVLYKNKGIAIQIATPIIIFILAGIFGVIIPG